MAEGEGERDRRSMTSCERSPSSGSIRLRDRRLAEEADPDRGHRDPDLAGGQDLSIFSSCSSTSSIAGLALGGERLEPAAPGAHERELGSDEQPVEEHEHDQADEGQGGHRALTPRGATSREVVVHGDAAEGSSGTGARTRARPRSRADDAPAERHAGARPGPNRPGSVAVCPAGSDQSQDPVPRRARRVQRAASPARFVVPGHKGGPGADPGLIEAFGERAARDGHPRRDRGDRRRRGPGRQPLRARRSCSPPRPGAPSARWFLVNGGSGGNHVDLPDARPPRRAGGRPAQRPLLDDRRDGPRRAAARASSRPRSTTSSAIAHCATPGDARARRSTPSPTRSRRWSPPPPTSAPSPTSPALAEVAHAAGVPLIVDEAWGAHLRFSARAPRLGPRMRRRHGALVDAQDRRQPHPVGDPAPRRQRRTSTRPWSTAR